MEGLHKNGVCSEGKFENHVFYLSYQGMQKLNLFHPQLFDSQRASRRGFEPPTCPLGGGCAIQLCHRDFGGS